MLKSNPHIAMRIEKATAITSAKMNWTQCTIWSHLRNANFENQLYVCTYIHIIYIYIYVGMYVEVLIHILYTYKHMHIVGTLR